MFPLPLLPCLLKLPLMPPNVNIFTKQNCMYVINAHFTFFKMQCYYTHNINKNGSISDLFYRVIWLYT